MSYRVYLFDFDYTIADSHVGIVMCYRHVLEKHGFLNVSDEAIVRTIGMTIEDSLTLLSGVEDEGTIAAWRIEYSKKADEVMNRYTVLFPEAVEAVRELKRRGFRCGIISTKNRTRIEACLAANGLEGLFDVVVGRKCVINAKPDPEGTDLAIARLGASKAETLYIGDSLIDAFTARNAQVDFAAVTTGCTAREEFIASGAPYVAIMKDLSELPLLA